jgi:RecB family endonuclease NucS
MTPLQRQYYVDGQVCDILAIDHDKRLVVIELKNSEDRYIVQQLTRYYASLQEKKAFPLEIDCYQPSRLIAITPKFHKHNLIDREYSKLSFEFLEFQVIQENNYLYLTLSNIDSKQVIKAKIPHQENDTYKLPENLPEPPKVLQNILIKGTPESKNKLLEIRQRLLGFHDRIQEITATGVVKYGRGKTKLCAEIPFDSSSKQTFIWLYLPMIHMGRPAVGRMRILTKDWNNIQYINYIPAGKKSGSLYKFDDFKHHINPQITTNQSNQLDILIDIALETWLNKL